MVSMASAAPCFLCKGQDSNAQAAQPTVVNASWTEGPVPVIPALGMGLAEGSRVQGQLGPHTKVKVSLEHAGRHHLKNKHAKREEEEGEEREGRREERISPGYPQSSLLR